MSRCSLAAISQYVLFSTECIAECLEGSIANPVIIFVYRPETYRITLTFRCVKHVAFTEAGLLSRRNLFQVGLDDVSIEVCQFLTLLLRNLIGCHGSTLSILTLPAGLYHVTLISASSSATQKLVIE